MSFRATKNIKNIDYIRFNLTTPITKPLNTLYQEKVGYRFNISDRNSVFDYYNGYILIKYHLDLLANGANIGANVLATPVLTSTINDATSLINHIMITSSGKKLYDSNDLHRISFVKSLVEFSQDYARSIGTESIYYLDDRANLVGDLTDAPDVGAKKRAQIFAESKIVYALIKLNRFSFFQELSDKLLPPMNLEFDITFNDDREVIYRIAGGATRYIIDDLQLWLPRLNFTAEGQMLVNSSFLRSNQWTYLREFVKHSPPTTAVSGIFQITPAVKSPKHVFVYLQRNKTNNELQNMHIFDTFKLNAGDNACKLVGARLQVGSNNFFPQLEYTDQQIPRLYRDLHEYSYRSNDLNSGVLIDMEQFETLYGVLYFDIRNLKEDITNDPLQIQLDYRLNVQATDEYMIYAIVLYEETVIINAIGNELVVV